MATSTYGTPYVQGSDLVSAYPTASSNLATRVDEVSYKRNGLNAQTGTTYTLVVGDAGKTITLSNASPVAVTLPQDSVATLPTWAVVTLYNLGAGDVTISQGTGATLQGGSITLAQYQVTSVIKLSANTYGQFDGAPISGLYPSAPTSIANSGGSASLSGNTVTFTGVASISLNGCFTSTYKNYRVMINHYNISGSTYLLFRTRAAGTDHTGANYNFALAEQQYAAATLVTRANGSASTGAYINYASAANSLSVVGFDIYEPQAAALTMLTVNSTTNDRAMFGGTVVTVTTSFDGFTVYSSSGNVTGDIRVYGYRV